VSLTEALDLTTATGRAMAGLLSVFAEFEHEILRERIRAGIAKARLKGKHLGRPVTAGKHAGQIRKLHHAGVSKAEIARRLDIGRTSVKSFWQGVKKTFYDALEGPPIEDNGPQASAEANPNASPTSESPSALPD
jgi:DNA invertase Pin-like site-specific DNA recombinase